MLRRSLVLVSICAVALGANCDPSAALSAQTTTQPSPSASPSAASEIHFSGEVLHGQIFERDIGHGLLFRLTPAASDEGGGWVIQILPATETAADDPVEFAEIATPPYHSYNERYLAAAFGYSAREAVQITVRKFYFVQSVDDQRRADDVVNAALYPSTASEGEKVRAAEEATSVNLGRGELRIIHSRVTPGKGGVPDTIAWVKFEVALDFSPGFTLRQVLVPQPQSAHR
jgi:hypothetical protein